ncbi:hypothetical protein Tco_1019968 [Tanacetum coccineum]|uniref:Transposase (Putative), gypsy type n=1 Tax=Tanacetum coccineum TaxID=301880 RepID=A0ABQ5FYP2_9ASTR
MSAVTDIKCALTQKALDAFSTKYHIPDEVHPVLPNQNDTMHERPAGKIILLRYSCCPPFSVPEVPRSIPVLDMDIFAFIHIPDPTKVKIVERERNEDEPLLLQTTVGRTVPLLPVAPDRAKSSGGDANIQLVNKATDTVAEDVAPLQPRRQRKRKTMVVDAGEASHPPKKLRMDHETPSGRSVAGKSRSVVHRLLAGAVLNADVRGGVIPTLPFVTSSVSAMLEREGGDHIDSVVGHNLCTIGASQRFVISSDSSHHSGPTIAEAEVDSLARSSIPLMTTVTTVTATVDPTLVAKEKNANKFLVGGIRTVIDPNTDLQKVYVPQWSVTNGSLLDDGRVCREMVDESAPPKFFAFVRRMEHGQLFTKFNVEAARQMSLSAAVRMRAEYNVKERRRLKSEAEAAEAIRLRVEASNFETVEKSLRDEVNALKERNTIPEKERTALDVKVMDLEALVVGKERELTGLNAQLTSVHELELSSSGLQEKVTVYEDCMGQLEKFQDDRMKEVNDKFDKLYADFIEIALHLEEKFYPHLLTTISGRRWLLTHGMKLAITKCLHSPEYLSALGAAIGKAIEKGMQDGLSAGITHGTEGRALTDVAVYNPSVEADYISSLQHLQNVNFSLLAELRSNKDATDGPHYQSPEKVVVGATALSLALDVSNIRVRKIKENIANQRPALRDVFVPLSEPFSAEVLMGTEGTSDAVPATADTTTTLSTTFASASTIAPISIDDYEVVGTDDQANAYGNAKPFPNVDDAE